MKQQHVAALTLLVLLIATGCGQKKVPLSTASTVPAASGNAVIGTDKNGNTTIDLKVHHLAKPEALTPAAAGYVVWIQPSGQPPQNAAILRVDKNLEGEFKGTTPYKNFDIFVTAENNLQATSPSGQEIMRQHVQR